MAKRKQKKFKKMEAVFEIEINFHFLKLKIKFTKNWQIYEGGANPPPLMGYSYSIIRLTSSKVRWLIMDWKKFLFGKYHYLNESDDGKKKVEVYMSFGLIPSLLIAATIIWLITIIF